MRMRDLKKIVEQLVLQAEASHGTRLDPVTIPESFTGDPFLYGAEVEFTPSPGALIAGLWTFTIEAPTSRAWRYHWDAYGVRQIGTGQSNPGGLNPHILERQMPSPGGNTAVLFWLPRAEGPYLFRAGLNHNPSSPTENGSAVIRDQHLHIFEIAP
jgi:hypothetical protein